MVNDLGKFRIFAALIYVTDTEEKAVSDMYRWEDMYIEGDRQTYRKAVAVCGGKEYTIIAARQNEMGMTASATLSMKIIEHFRPQYLIMPGIAAGTGEEDISDQLYGDVILANAVWNYSNGKFVSPDNATIKFGSVGFIPRPTKIAITPKVLPYLEKAVNSENNQTHVHIGHIASGSTVVANREIVEKQIHSQYRETKGLEMEGYGVVYAAENATEPRPIPLVAKSVCDFADSRKSDVFQKFAAYTSCEFVKYLMENGLPDREEAKI